MVTDVYPRWEAHKCHILEPNTIMVEFDGRGKVLNKTSHAPTPRPRAVRRDIAVEVFKASQVSEAAPRLTLRQRRRGRPPASRLRLWRSRARNG